MAGLLTEQQLLHPPQVKLINLQEKDIEGILFDQVRNMKVATLLFYVLSTSSRLFNAKLSF